MNTADALLRFISKSPTAFQAVDEIASVLNANGYARLDEGDAWMLEAGKGYFVWTFLYIL